MIIEPKVLDADKFIFEHSQCKNNYIDNHINILKQRKEKAHSPFATKLLPIKSGPCLIYKHDNDYSTPRSDRTHMRSDHRICIFR